VASSELLERVAHRYGFHWLIATNKRHSLYRIHNGTMLWAIVTALVLTSGIMIARRRSPEIKEIRQSESDMEMIATAKTLPQV